MKKNGKKNRNQENREMARIAKGYLNSLFPKTPDELEEEKRQQRLCQR